TDSHFCMLDLNGIESDTGFPLRGEPAVRLLDMAGIVANKNTIPGDEVTALAMGIRLGTPWLTQRGFGPAEVDEVARLIHKTVTHIRPFSYVGLAGELPRGKIDLDLFEEIKHEVAGLAARGVAETEDKGREYPHYYKLPGQASEQTRQPAPDAAAVEDALRAAREGMVVFDLSQCGALLVTGERATPSLQQILTCDVETLEQPGWSTRGFILDQDSLVMDDVSILRLEPDTGDPGGPERYRERYVLLTNRANHERVKAWLRALGDGYTLFDRDDVFAKVEGPIIVEDLAQVEPEQQRFVLSLRGPQAAKSWQTIESPTDLVLKHSAQEIEILVSPTRLGEVREGLIAAGGIVGGLDAWLALRAEAGLPDYADSGRPSGLELYNGGHQDRFELRKPYFVGGKDLDPVRTHSELPTFDWQEPEDAPLKRTPLYDWHKAHTRKVIPFAGWEMPVWYTGVLDEHNAVRKAAGLFDVAHMGVFEISGPHATEFLDLVLSNYARWFEPGESFYSYLLDHDGRVIDDLMVYRRRRDLYLMVVNAVNAEKDWAWLNAVNDGQVLIDRERPGLQVLRPAVLRNLKDPSSGADMRVDLALQGPASLVILQSLTGDPRLKDRLARVSKTGLIECELGGPSTSSGERFDLVMARTGYTGEDIGYEIFVHPDRAVAFWETVLAAGEPFGLKPCGLAARDSTRTEAGLPLYGHELAGPFDISPMGAGFGSYVKLHKPYFVGRKAFMEEEKTRKMEIARFRMNERGVRMPKTGDPVVNRRGRAIGWVTSAAVDVDGWILGLAYIESRYHREDDEIGLFSLPARPVVERDNKADLQPGDKIQLADQATILMRFPEDEERSHWRGEEVTSLPRFLPSGE
ncbi:MAG: glycine cleavage system aminomethyltransferase GcvT, partial [Anaerolineae bacterium]